MKPKSYRSSIILLTVAALVAMTFNVKGSATRPTSAVVDDLNGTIRMRSGSGQPTLIQRYAELPASITLLVPGTRRGSTEHWAHLRFRSSSSRNITLVQAGTDSSDSEYRFPCEHRSGTGLWGVRQVGSNACERITVNGGGWRSQLNPPFVAQKSSTSQRPLPIAQENASQFTIFPANTLTLLYVYQTPDSTIVNVLTGSARVRTPSRSYILRAGVRYIDYDDDEDGDTGPIPEDVYTARAVQIFLDPNNWSEDLGVQIGEFQRSVEQTRATVPLAPPDPDPIFEPDPLDGDGVPEGPSNPEGSDSNDEPPAPDPDSPDSSSPNDPPVSDDVLDGVPSDVFIDQGEIDYGGSSGQDDEFVPPKSVRVLTKP